MCSHCAALVGSFWERFRGQRPHAGFWRACLGSGFHYSFSRCIFQQGLRQPARLARMRALVSLRKRAYSPWPATCPRRYRENSCWCWHLVSTVERRTASTLHLESRNRAPPLERRGPSQLQRLCPPTARTRAPTEHITFVFCPLFLLLCPSPSRRCLGSLGLPAEQARAHSQCLAPLWGFFSRLHAPAPEVFPRPDRGSCRCLEPEYTGGCRACRAGCASRLR